MPLDVVAIAHYYQQHGSMHGTSARTSISERCGPLPCMPWSLRLQPLQRPQFILLPILLIIILEQRGFPK